MVLEALLERFPSMHLLDARPALRNSVVLRGAPPDRFRVYSDHEGDIARWRCVETPESP